MACAARAAASLAVLLVAGLTAMVASPAAERDVHIELKGNATISGADVRLGDIAFLTTRDLTLLRRLVALPVGPAPRPGGDAWIDRETIESWVYARAGLRTLSYLSPDEVPSLHWSGATGIRIESASQQLAGAVLIDAGRTLLVRHLSGQGARTNVQPLSAVRDLTLPAGTPTLRVRPIAEAVAPSRRMVVWIDVWVNDRFIRTVPVSYEVSAWAPRQVATAEIASGTLFDPVVRQGATHTEEIDLAAARYSARTPATALADAAPPQDVRLRRALRPGEVVTDAHIEVAPAVGRGRWARLLARSGDVSVESRVEVLQDGRQGQIVRVKVPGARGEVLARVVGQGEVELQP